MNENIYLAVIFVVGGGIFLYRGLTGNAPTSAPPSLNDQQPPAPNQRQRRMNTGLGIAFIIFGVIYAVSFLLRAH